jgi:hypothetical protein
MNPMMMQMLMGQNGGKMDPMTMMLLQGGKMDPMTMMLLSQQKGGQKMDPMMMQMLMSQSGGKMDPMMMILMMNQQKETPTAESEAPAKENKAAGGAHPYEG